MTAYWTLVRRELGGHFLSWTGYVVVAAVLLLLGLSFVDLFQKFNGEALDQPLTSLFYYTHYFWLILLMFPPVITMRSFAAEKSTGTFETLMTTPVSDLQVLLGKFTGAILFYLLICVPLLSWVLIARPYLDDPSTVDLGTLSATFMGLLLWGSLYISLGCLASALTRSQIIAVMLSLTVGLGMFLIGYIAMGQVAKTGLPGWQVMLFSYLNLFDYMMDFWRGVVDTRPLVLFLSGTVFFLFLTLKVVESRRWK